MLPQKRRIARKELSLLLTKGKRYNSEHLLLYVGVDSQKNLPKSSRFSFSVSKKVSRNAVDRNKLRRQGYSIIQKHTSVLKSGYMCFFSFKKAKGKLLFSQLEEEIVGLLSSSLVLI